MTSEATLVDQRKRDLVITDGSSAATRHIDALARSIRTKAVEIAHPLANARYQTPLRYPGAKSAIAPLISRLIEAAAKHPCVGGVDLIVEPFAGGASTSLRLVGSGMVKRALLADADPLVAAFWQVAAAQPAALTARIRHEHAEFVAPGPATAIERWDYWRAWSPTPGMSQQAAKFETAVKCLYLNRTTFSGILHGRAGPIGGRAQTSRYGIGCRFNPDALAERIDYVGHLYATGRLIDVWCMDWRKTLANTASIYKTLVPNRVIAYIDPPYLRKSDTLYNTSFSKREPKGRAVLAPAGWPSQLDHEMLAAYLTTKMRYRWLLSYDYDPVLLESCLLYGRDRMNPSRADRLDAVKQWRISKRVVRLRYSASATVGRGNSDELLLTTLPASTVPVNDTFRPVPA